MNTGGEVDRDNSPVRPSETQDRREKESPSRSGSESRVLEQADQNLMIAPVMRMSRSLSSLES